ncbi:PREDICTED: DNA-directed RNA polymerase II subunit RPB1-like [Priapulus caudatus]|uniref:DNA-directed RNA polymerase II subunit RPB1-like n=1 Tax=Priapulus caudatus TaxID=37621 RepID=A0ABM1DV75_PRICU|nr:PREDICTED: DNA-directed RNA polymerase II subunit RPB1-like [Priapulus caudatus]
MVFHRQESSSYHRPSSGGDGEQTSYGATPSYSPVSNYNPYSSSRSSSGGGGYSGRGVTYRSRDGSYASQPSYSSSQSYQAPATTYEASVPTYQAPAPTYQRPAPTYQPSPPTYQESVPTYEAPAPRYETATYEAPAPVYLDVQPSYGQQQQQQQHNGYTKSPEYFTTTKYGPIESGALRGQGQKSSAVEFARQGQASGTLYSADTAEAAEAAKKSRGYEYRYREGHTTTQPKTFVQLRHYRANLGVTKDKDGYGNRQHGAERRYQ